MKLNRRHLLLGTLTALALSGCQAPAGPEQLKGTAAHQQLPLTTPRVPEFTTVSRDLMWQLMQLADQQANTIASPASLTSTLALLGLGASRSTATDLDRVFGMGSVERAAAANALRSAMAKYDSLPDTVDAKSPPKVPILHQASHLLIVEPDVEPVAPEFLDDASRYFDASVEKATRSATPTILDSWVRRHTANLIDKSAIEVTEHTRLVVQDAILFAAAWLSQFESEDRIEFHRLDGDTVSVDGVRDSFDCAYTEHDGWQAIRLPYTEGFAMDVLLPPEGTSPYQAEPALLTTLTQQLDIDQQREVKVWFPTLDIRCTLDLKDLISRFGIDFGTFDGIFPDAVVEQAMQQARLQITAKGTVGAAVTEVSVKTEATAIDTGPIMFTVDRPYLLDVVAQSTGWSLFLAAITDPTS